MSATEGLEKIAKKVAHQDLYDEVEFISRHIEELNHTIGAQHKMIEWYRNELIGVVENYSYLKVELESHSKKK